MGEDGWGIQETRMAVDWSLLKLGVGYMEIYCAVFSTYVPVQNFSKIKVFHFPLVPSKNTPKTTAGLLSRMDQLGKLSQRTLPKYSAKTGFKRKNQRG